ncbi:ATP-binding protein [Kiritimatiellota bacterium B12222]|nr:ATP-binding protein [Kiritimatiellota bacterium B12222]
MKLPTNSIRWRLQIWYASLLLIALAGLSLAVLRLSRIHRIRLIDQQIVDRQRSFFDVVFRQDPQAQKRPMAEGEEPPPDPKKLLAQLQEESLNPSSSLLQEFSDTDPGYYYFALADRDGAVLFASENTPEGFTFPHRLKRDDFERNQFRGPFREHLRRAPGGIRVCFGKESSHSLKEMDQFAVSIVLFASGFWLVGLAGGWWIVGRALRPVKEISETAVEIAEGNFDKRIDLAGDQNELHQLGQVLNHTFDELEASMERQRQFTGNASHELRTPLTVILSETQRMLKRKRAPEEYRASLEVCQKAGLRMKALVEGLLLLARQEISSVVEVKERCDLKCIVEESMGTLRHVASEHDIVLMGELVTAEISGDASALRILIDNLIENAISHHSGQGRVVVRLCNLEDLIELEVEDDGPGIAAEYHDKIFERFYQIDKSRSSGHSGLGLALVNKIAENHDGECAVFSDLGKGSRFIVQFQKS